MSMSLSLKRKAVVDDSIEVDHKEKATKSEARNEYDYAAEQRKGFDAKGFHVPIYRNWLYKLHPTRCSNFGCDLVIREYTCGQCSQLSHINCHCTGSWSAPRCQSCDKILCAGCAQWKHCSICPHLIHLQKSPVGDVATCLSCLRQCSRHPLGIYFDPDKPMSHSGVPHYYCQKHITTDEEGNSCCTLCQFTLDVKNAEPNTEKKKILDYVAKEDPFLSHWGFPIVYKNKRNCHCKECKEPIIRWNRLLMTAYKIPAFFLSWKLFPDTLWNKPCCNCKLPFRMSSRCENLEQCPGCKEMKCAMCRITAYCISCIASDKEEEEE